MQRVCKNVFSPLNTVYLSNLHINVLLGERVEKTMGVMGVIIGQIFIISKNIDI